TFAYDPVGRLTSATDDDTVVTFTYNSLDQVTSEALSIDGTTTKTTSYDWDDTGKRLESVTYPISGKVFTYAHDTLDRVSSISVDSKTVAAYAYEGPGLRVIKRTRSVDIPNQADFITEYAYDTLLRLTTITHKRNTVTHKALDYTWGDADWASGTKAGHFQRATYEDHTYEYDKLHRLTKDTKTGQSAHSYTYDDTQFLLDRRVGGSPVIEFEKSADGSHQVAEYHEGLHPAVTYDDAGNLVEKDYGGGLTEKFYYDHENRIAHIDGFSADFWFRYDALGRCVAQKTGSTETFFYYSGLHIVEETTTGLSLNRLTLFGNRIDEILLTATISSGSLANH